MFVEWKSYIKSKVNIYIYIYIIIYIYIYIKQTPLFRIVMKTQDGITKKTLLLWNCETGYNISHENNVIIVPNEVKIHMNITMKLPLFLVKISTRATHALPGPSTGNFFCFAGQGNVESVISTEWYSVPDDVAKPSPPSAIPKDTAWTMGILNCQMSQNLSVAVEIICLSADPHKKYGHMGVSKNRGVYPPKWMVLFHGKTILKTDDLGVKHPLFFSGICDAGLSPWATRTQVVKIYPHQGRWKSHLHTQNLGFSPPVRNEGLARDPRS